MADKVLPTSVSATIAKPDLSTLGYSIPQSSDFKVEVQGQKISRRARRFLKVPESFIQGNDSKDGVTSLKGDGGSKKAKLSPSTTVADYADHSCTYVVASAIEKEGRTFVVPKHFLQRPLLKLSASAPGSFRLHGSEIPPLIRNADAFPEHAVSPDVTGSCSLPMSRATTKTLTESAEKEPRFLGKTTSTTLEPSPGCPTPDIYPRALPSSLTVKSQKDRMKSEGLELARKRRDALVHGFLWPSTDTKLFLRGHPEADLKGLHARAVQVLQRVVPVKEDGILKAAQLTPNRTKSTAARKPARECEDIKNAGVFAVPRLPAAKTRSTRARGQMKTKVSPYRFPANIFDDDVGSLDVLSSYKSLPRLSTLAKRSQTQPRAALVLPAPLSLTKSNLGEHSAPITATDLTRSSATKPMLNAKLIVLSRQGSTFSGSAVAEKVGKNNKNNTLSSCLFKEVKKPLRQGDGASNENSHPGYPAQRSSEKPQVSAERKGPPKTGASKASEAAKRAHALEEHVKRIYSLKQVSFVPG